MSYDNSDLLRTYQAEVDALKAALAKERAEHINDVAIGERRLIASEAALSAALLRAEEAERGWRCFHCTEFFTSAEAAREHFGADMEDEGPGCVDQLRTDEVERLREVRVAREEWVKARNELEVADEKLGLLATYESEIGRYFGMVAGVRASTPHQAWLRFEAEQGRAEAAESRAEVLADALREASDELDVAMRILAREGHIPTPDMNKTIRDRWRALAPASPPGDKP